MEIYCCGCSKGVNANLVSGKEIYQHRPDLYSLPFWQCPHCKNFVGCHHKTKNRTTPLGTIPTNEIRQARKNIHAVLDPLWKSGKIKRSVLYARLSQVIGRQYHTAEINTTDEARSVLEAIHAMGDE